MSHAHMINDKHDEKPYSPKLKKVIAMTLTNVIYFFHFVYKQSSLFMVNVNSVSLECLLLKVEMLNTFMGSKLK